MGGWLAQLVTRRGTSLILFFGELLDFASTGDQTVKFTNSQRDISVK